MFVKGGGVSLLKSYTSGEVIWMGCNARKTHAERERREERKEGRVFFIGFRASFVMNLSL